MSGEELYQLRRLHRDPVSQPSFILASFGSAGLHHFCGDSIWIWRWKETVSLYFTFTEYLGVKEPPA